MGGNGSLGNIDLHVHTTASDGTLRPKEVVSYAAKQGLRAVAITDHDTVSGVSEALQASAETGTEVVPGVEISVDYSGEMHILGYYIDMESTGLLRGLQKLREYRDQRNPLMIEKLRALGFEISMEEVIQAADGKVIGRPHFASVMKEKGYVRDYIEAFDRFIGAGKPAYVKKESLTPREGIEMVAAAGGIPVLAHPKYLKVGTNQAVESLVDELIGYGLKGIEVFYTTHSIEETTRFRDIATRHGLLMTGGTDFHGANKPDIDIGRGNGGLMIPYELLTKLKEARPAEPAG